MGIYGVGCTRIETSIHMVVSSFFHSQKGKVHPTRPPGGLYTSARLSKKGV